MHLLSTYSHRLHNIDKIFVVMFLEILYIRSHFLIKDISVVSSDTVEMCTTYALYTVSLYTCTYANVNMTLYIIYINTSSSSYFSSKIFSEKCIYPGV